MQSGLQICISTECFGFMCAPSIKDKIQFIFWIYRVEKPVDKIDDDEAVLPRVEPMMSYAGMNVFGCEQVKQPFDLLSIGDTVLLFSGPFPAAILFNRCLSFLIERKHNSIWWWLFFQRVDPEFFLANCGSLLYWNRLLFRSFILSCFKRDLMVSMEMESTTPWLIRYC